MFGALVLLASAAAAQPGVIVVNASALGASQPFVLPFWSTQPLGAHITPPTSSLDTQNNSALECAVLPLGRCMFSTDDEWLGRVLPMWRVGAESEGNLLTLPFSRNLSAVRMLGGLTHNWPHANASGAAFVPLPHWDLCYRDARTGAIVHNWTRMDATLDPFVANGVRPSPLVLDNIPYAFVAEPNRFYGGFGLGSAPDNVTEFGEFVEAMVTHLAARYGHAEVDGWRFRLGTEADGPRLGPRWEGADGNDPVAMPTASGVLKNFSHGLDQYVATYIAASAAVKRVLPHASFGPSNFAGLGAPNATTNTTTESMMNLMAKRLFDSGAAVDFIAMSEYSREAPGQPKGARQASPQAMKAGIERLEELGRLATLGTLAGATPLPVPLEVHEYGWAQWVGDEDQSTWPHGSFGAAYNVASWMWQRQAGVDRVFSWGYKFDDSLAVADPAGSGATAAHAGRPLVSGWGWTLGAMELLLGTDGDTVGAEMVVDTPAEGSGAHGQGGGAYNYTFGVFRMAQPKARAMHFLLSAFSGNFTDHSALEVKLTLCAGDFPGGEAWWDLSNRSAVAVVERVFNRTTSVHDIIQADLSSAGGFREGLLTKTDASVDMVRTMATAKGLQQLVAEQRSTGKYLAISDRSLQPQPLSGVAESVEAGGGEPSLVVTLKVERPALVLLSFTAANLVPRV